MREYTPKEPDQYTRAIDSISIRPSSSASEWLWPKMNVNRNSILKPRSHSNWTSFDWWTGEVARTFPPVKSIEDKLLIRCSRIDHGEECCSTEASSISRWVSVQLKEKIWIIPPTTRLALEKFQQPWFHQSIAWSRIQLLFSLPILQLRIHRSSQLDSDVHHYAENRLVRMARTVVLCDRPDGSETCNEQHQR